MQLPDTASLLYLSLVLLLLPWMAYRSSRKLKRDELARLRQSSHDRERIWYGTIFTQACLFAIAWLVGSTFGFEIFAVPHLTPGDLLAATIALAGLFVLRAIIRATRTDDERRTMVVYSLAPRTAREGWLNGMTGLFASISEEATYRGVAFQILWYSCGTAWMAALICAIAFALAHWIQGWKSMLFIFAMALLSHGLVQYTETLVLAMLVHAVFDFVAMYSIWRESLRLSSNDSGRLENAKSESEV